VRQISKHYLQSESWRRLRSEFRKEKGFNLQILTSPRLRLVGHVAHERRRRSIFHDHVLEAFYGPYPETGTPSHQLPIEVLRKIREIGKQFDADIVRLHSYESEPLGYYTLSEFVALLSTEKCAYKFMQRWTSIYPLDLHTPRQLNHGDASVRKNLRKASAIKIIRANSAEEIEEFLVKNASIKNRKRPKRREIRAYKEHNEHCVFFIAYDESMRACLGTLGFVHDDVSAMEVMSSTAKGPHSRGVQEKLHLACFDEAKNLNLRFFDLAGLEMASDKSWNSVAKFKMKFGGNTVESGFIEFTV
jgi:hypothetical protein